MIYAGILFEDVATDSYRARMLEGKRGEEEVAEALRTRFGLTLENVTEDRDRWEKVDRIVVAKSGARKTLQIKYREYGHDILFDAYEPFYGEGDPRTAPGRDMVSRCHLYACRVGPALHLIHGNALRSLVEQSLAFWRSQSSPIALGTTIETPKHVLVRVRADHHSGRPKMLLFIPAAAFDTKSIWTKMLTKLVAA